MAEQQVLGWGSGSAPLSRTTKGSEQFVVLAIDATFSGASATASFIPTVQVISDAGEEVGSFPAQTAVGAGDSATVTFAPFLGRSGGASSDTPGTSLDYAEAPAGVFNVTATTAATAQLWIQGNPIDFDGVTTATITVWASLATSNLDLVLELYMDNTDQGRIGQVSPGSLVAGHSGGGSLLGVGHVLPSAGQHTFDIRAWQTAGGTSSLLNPSPFPAVAFQPSFYQVTVSSPLS